MYDGIQRVPGWCRIVVENTGNAELQPSSKIDQLRRYTGEIEEQHETSSENDWQLQTSQDHQGMGELDRKLFRISERRLYDSVIHI